MLLSLNLCWRSKIIVFLNHKTFMIRTLYQADLSKILVIEQAVHIAPWTEETFKACFQAGYLGWAAEVEGTLVGFIIVSTNRDECHILNIGIALNYQHQGWGRKLLAHALNHAKQLGIGITYLEVRRSNSRAISLYKKMEFILIGERKDYYPTVAGHEDALIFARSLRDDWV
jgi:ribosomal-protein-alanine N-acetyltransferase